MNLPAINAALRDWVLSATGLADANVIDAYQSAPRPTPPFAVVYPPLAIARRGLLDEELLTSTAGIIERRGQREITIRVDTFGACALELAHLAADALQSYAVRDALGAVGLVVRDPGDVANLTSLLQTGFEARGQINPKFALADSVSEDVGWIETVSGTGIIDTAIVLPFTITSA